MSDGCIKASASTSKDDIAMAEECQVLHSGGCQCGAVRYALTAEPYGTHICHCRMCQKAFGAFYAPLTLIRYKDFAWTRGGSPPSSRVHRMWTGASVRPAARP